MTDYQPIACALHDEYELAVMRGRRVTLVWLDEAGQRQQAHVTPLDLVTRAGEEFLRVQDHNGETLDIRLDRIQSLQRDS